MEKKILFIGYCWGNAGSTWLSHLLNGHKDILCLHAPKFPRFDHKNYDDAVTIIDSVFRFPAMGGTYPLVGFTHGVPLKWHPKLSEIYKEQLCCFILTRHPIKRIQSNFALNKVAREKQVSANKKWEQNLENNYKRLVQQSGKHFPDDFDSLIFYRSCDAVNRILREYEQKLPFYKMEDLVSQEKVVNELLSYISDGTCQLDSEVIRKMQGTVVGGHAKRRLSVAETYDSWSEAYKEAYHHLVKREAFEIYKQLGYDFPHPI
jgi:hypothetical protein